jgi:hypothetical protein
MEESAVVDPAREIEDLDEDQHLEGVEVELGAAVEKIEALGHVGHQGDEGLPGRSVPAKISPDRLPPGMLIPNRPMSEC